MSAKRTNTPGKTVQTKKAKTPTKQAKAGKAKQTGAEAQILREGTAAAVATRLADRERTGDIQVGPEDVDPFAEDLMDADDFDSEVSLDDEDESHLSDLDGETGDAAAAVGLLPGSSFSSDDADSDGADTYELRVSEDGTCSFRRPGWIKGEAMTDSGEDEFEEIERRCQMFDDLAEWLTDNRPEFLRQPNPIHLGVNALKEFEDGLPSVSPSALLKRSGITKRMTEEWKIKAKSVGSYFSRYATGASLVWEDGSPLPLEFLFGIEARNAWVACAVRQFFEKIKQPLSTAVAIGKLSGITVPKDSSKKRKLTAASRTTLTQKEFVARANQMAGTKWADVMKAHF